MMTNLIQCQSYRSNRGLVEEIWRRGLCSKIESASPQKDPLIVHGGCDHISLVLCLAGAASGPILRLESLQSIFANVSMPKRSRLSSYLKRWFVGW
jgi:hypothetical protein